MAVRSKSSRISDRSTVRVRLCGCRTAAASSRVRATVVTGIPLWVVTSTGVSVPERWIRTPSRGERPFRVAIVMSIFGSDEARRSQCARPLVWLSAALSPQARVAAIHRASRELGRWPTANTPR
jgi:hypothetical protein